GGARGGVTDGCESLRLCARAGGIMTPAPNFPAIVEATRRRIRVSVLVAIVAAAAAAIPAALLVAWLLASWAGWRAPSAAPLVLEIVAALLAGGASYQAVRRWLRPLDAARVAASTESQLGLAE